MAEDLSGLAMIARDTGHSALAQTPLQRAAAILEKTLGPEHPDVAAAVGATGRVPEQPPPHSADPAP